MSQLHGIDALLGPINDAYTQKQLSLSAQRFATRIDRVLLATDVQAHVLRHYLLAVAEVIETDLRNRVGTPKLGSVFVSMRYSIELDAEIQRRVARYINLRDAQIERQEQLGNDDARVQRCQELLDDDRRTLQIFQVLALLLANRGVDVQIEDTQAAQAVIFGTINESRVLRALVASQRATSRMPGHRPLDCEQMREFQRVLDEQTKLFRTNQLTINEYVEVLRRFVYTGTTRPPRKLPTVVPPPPPAQTAATSTTTPDIDVYDVYDIYDE